MNTFTTKTIKRVTALLILSVCLNQAPVSYADTKTNTAETQNIQTRSAEADMSGMEETETEDPEATATPKVLPSQEVTDKNGNTYVWSYDFDNSKMNAPAKDVHLNASVDEKNKVIKTDIIIPDSFKDEYGVHKVQSLGDSEVSGKDSVFVGCTFQRGIAPIVDATDCTELKTINAYAFNVKTNILYKLPVTVTTVKKCAFRSGGGNVVYCENPNITFEGTDETSDDFLWIGPEYSTAKTFFDGKCDLRADLGTEIVSYKGPDTFRLSFDENGDSMDPVSMDNGLKKDKIYVFKDYTNLSPAHEEATSLVSVPTRTNYKFDGFYYGDQL